MAEDLSVLYNLLDCQIKQGESERALTEFVCTLEKKSENLRNFVVYMIYRMLHVRLWLQNLSSHVELGTLLFQDRVQHSKTKFETIQGHIISTYVII